MSKNITTIFLVLIFSGSVFIDFATMSVRPKNDWYTRIRRTLPIQPVAQPSLTIGSTL